MRASRLLLASALLAATPGGVAAQAAVAAPGDLRDALARVSDSIALARQERDLLALVRGSRGHPADHLQLGYVVLRLADLGRAHGYEEAAAEFGWVTRSEPTWAAGWYGLGLAEVGLAAERRGSLAVAAALMPAARAFARAVDADPAVANRLAEEAEQARRMGQRERGLALLEGLRQAARRAGATGSVLAAHARVERDLGDPTVALAAFEVWRPLAGRLEGLALLEVARTRFLLDRLDGAGPYYLGAEADLPVVVAQYREDIALIASPRELQAFDQNRGGARADMLRRFWRLRDRAAMRPDGARLAEHYRRLYLARRLYPRAVPGPSALPAVGMSLADYGVDDRGLILVRHGEPDQRLIEPAAGGAERWHYRREEGDLSLAFIADAADGAHRLVEPMAAAATGAVFAGGRRSGNMGRATLAVPGRHGGPESASIDRASYLVARATDDFRRRFARPLGARVDAVLFEARGQDRLLHLALAVPFDSLGAAWLGPGHEYPLRLRLGVFGGDGQPVVALDSVVRPQAGEVDGGRWLAGVVTVSLPPGRWRYRLEVTEGDSLGTVFPVRALDAEPGRGALALGDLALGLPSAPWRHALGEARQIVPFLPTGAVRQGVPAQLGYAVRAGAGAALVSEITVARIDAEPGVALAWRRSLTPSGIDTVVLDTLDTRRLRPGSYRVEVQLRDGTGGQVRRWREFDVWPAGRAP